MKDDGLSGSRGDGSQYACVCGSDSFSQDARAAAIPLAAVVAGADLVELHVLQPRVVAGRRLVGEEERVRLVLVNQPVDAVVEFDLLASRPA